MPGEAPLEQTPAGLEPVDDGWFIVNVADSVWHRNDVYGASCGFESGRNDAAIDEASGDGAVAFEEAAIVERSRDRSGHRKLCRN